MNALWITCGTVGYLTGVVITMRVIGGHAERRDPRQRARELERNGLIGEVAPALIWPITLLFVALAGLLVGLHAIATKGIGKETR